MTGYLPFAHGDRVDISDRVQYQACFQPSYQGELRLKVPGGIFASADPARYRGVIPEQARNEEDWTEGGYNWAR